MKRKEITNDPITKQELYIIQDALIIYKLGYYHPPLCPSTKDKIKTIQKKLLQMEDNAND